MLRPLLCFVAMGFGALGLISANAQPPKAAAKDGSTNDVFKFRSLGFTTNERAKLSGERRWQTRDGRLLAGQASLSRRANFVAIDKAITYRNVVVLNRALGNHTHAS